MIEFKAGRDKFYMDSIKSGCERSHEEDAQKAPRTASHFLVYLPRFFFVDPLLESIEIVTLIPLHAKLTLFEDPGKMHLLRRRITLFEETINWMFRKQDETDQQVRVSYIAT